MLMQEGQATGRPVKKAALCAGFLYIFAWDDAGIAQHLSLLMAELCTNFASLGHWWQPKVVLMHPFLFPPTDAFNLHIL
jgi:hypothetical protein